MIRILPLLAVLGVLAGCAGGPQQKPRQAATGAGSEARALGEAGAATVDALPSCVPLREHDESLYTAGGLYAPGVPDRPPPTRVDVSNVPEPVPRSEPRSRHGNGPTYTVLGRTYRVLASAEGYVSRGIASWYGYKFHGRHTSNRERFDMCQLTAAHKTLPLPSFVRVTNLENGQSVVVRVNDRGPFHDNRIIDLSYAAAHRIGMKYAGTARVEVRALKGPDDRLTAAAATRQRFEPQGVQVGSFGDRNNAERLIVQLREAGIPGASLDHEIVGQRSLWRVRFPVQTADAARALVERILAAGLASPHLFSE